MKKLICAVLVIALLSILAVPVLAAGSSVTLSSSSASLNRGDTFTVTATLSNTEAIALGTVKLTYDSNVFELVGGSCHVAGASIAQVIPAQNAGTFMFSGNPTVVSGQIFTFNLKVKDTAAFGNYTISSSAAIGVSTGSPISSGSVNISVVCSHSYGAWSQKDKSDHQRTCSICGDVDTQAHGWDGGTVTAPADCKVPGEKSYTCADCGDTKTEILPTTDEHSYGSWTKVDDSKHTRTCSVCQKPENADHTWDGGTVTKPADCKETGEKRYTCTDCGDTKTEILPTTDEHSYGSWTKVDGSKHTHTCSVCQKPENADHTWNDGTVTKPADCKGSGEKVYTCTGCGDTKLETLPQLTTHTYDHGCDTDCNVCGVTRVTSHRYQTGWSKDGSSHWHACSECGSKKDTADHVPGPEATETTAQKCTVCDYTIKAALGHTHNYSEDWTTDEAGHWHACSGCEERDAAAEHSFDNACDTDCAVCGYVRQTTHSYSEKWESDEANHWRTCSGCEEKAEEAAHTPGAEATATTAQVCTVCQHELAPALGGEATTAPDGTDATEPVEAPPAEENEFPWWIPLGALAAIAAGAAAFLIIKKKKA